MLSSIYVFRLKKHCICLNGGHVPNLMYSGSLKKTFCNFDLNLRKKISIERIPNRVFSLPAI